MGDVLEPRPPQWRRDVVKYEPKSRRRRMSFWHLWIPCYGVLVIYGLWQFARLTTGYRGSFIELVMSLENSIELYSPAGFIVIGVAALFTVLLMQPAPRKYFPPERLMFTDVNDKPPDSDHKPAA